MNLAARLTDTITVQSQTGIADGAAAPSWGTQRTVACKIKQTTKMYKTARGDFAPASHEFITDQAILATDRVWPPGADTTDNLQARQVVQVADETTLDASYHLWRGLLGGGQP